ncbi:FHA domain-containing protein [Phragmitibacter flavus]|uniref:FHA domain-containing protein n=1 Tax=Phragmitibacter flavus TaxID=2576071 RepID=A0A5R8KG35_9BACT|nr:FHA domain-containing protein [Phragmitibacter flavus]TLD71250.1 FHA domain-containing protein [Phragmitibacter flavus]
MAHIVFTLEDGSEILADLNADIVTVGRHPESLVVLPSGSVSGQHATVKRRGDSYFVQDLGTTNGTRVNGVEVEEVKLEHGDLVSFGDVAGYFYATEEASAAWEEPQAEAPVLESLPEPQAPVLSAQSEPSLFLPEKYSPVPRAGQPRKTGYVPVKPTRPVTQYKESSGCAGFLFFIGFLVFAFLVGLHVRHGQEHSGSILLMDVIEKLKADQVESGAEVTPESGTSTTPAADSAPAPAAPASDSGSSSSQMGGGMMGGDKEPSM